MKSRKIIAAVSLAVILVLVVGTTTASAASLSELRKQISESRVNWMRERNRKKV